MHVDACYSLMHYGFVRRMRMKDKDVMQRVMEKGQQDRSMISLMYAQLML